MNQSFSLNSIFVQQHFSQVRHVLEGHSFRAEIVDIIPSVELAFSVVKPKVSPKSAWLQTGLTGIILLVIAISATLFTPALYFRLFPADTQPVLSAEQGSPLGGLFRPNNNLSAPEESTRLQPTSSPSPTPKPLPPQDETLPEGRWLIIPRIGVRTELADNQTAEEALAKGVWMVPEYGKPGEVEAPMILAAHRYGWQWWWKTDYWKYHSFHLLPELEPGDLVEVIDDKRKYHYEVYAGEEGEEISDYKADMILYTCKFLNSPLRHFRYARLVDWNTDTQA